LEWAAHFFRKAHTASIRFSFSGCFSQPEKRQNFFPEEGRMSEQKSIPPNPFSNTKLEIFCQVILPKKYLKIGMMESKKHWNIGRME